MLSLQVAVCNLVWLSSWRYNFWPRKVFEVVIPWMHTHAVAILIHWLSSQQFMITWLQTAQICAFHIFEDFVITWLVNCSNVDQNRIFEKFEVKIATAFIWFHVITSLTYFSGLKTIRLCRPYLILITVRHNSNIFFIISCIWCFVKSFRLWHRVW